MEKLGKGRWLRRFFAASGEEVRELRVASICDAYVH
jgi:hypothetical protein